MSWIKTLCLMSGVSNIVQIGDAAEIAEIEKSGVIRDKVAPEWFMNYRHAIDIDGNANSWSGLFPGLFNALYN